MRSFAAVCVVAGVLALSGLLLREAQSDAPPPAYPQTAKGVVYHDANENRVRDADEKPLPGVRVSNGSQIVSTNEQGQYTLPVDDDTTLFVIKPRGWRTPVNADQLPLFYYTHKPGGSPDLKYGGVKPTGPLPESVDFARRRSVWR